MKTFLVDLKTFSDAVDNEVVKNTKFNTLKTKVKNLEKNIPDATTLIHINQFNTGKQKFTEKIGDVDKKVPDISAFMTTIALNTKLVKLTIKLLIMINILLLKILIS